MSLLLRHLTRLGNLSILNFDLLDCSYYINPPLLIVKTFMISIQIVYLLKQLARILIAIDEIIKFVRKANT